MKRIFLSAILVISIVSCQNKPVKPDQPGTMASEPPSSESVLIASDIVTDVIIKPDPDSDPWEIEKVAGYKGDIMINNLFDQIYNGSLIVYDYHTGEPMSAKDVKDLEKEYNNDRSKIGKLSFTEDWYFTPSSGSISKITKSVVLGYELYNNDGKVYGYRAAFKASLGK